MNTASEETTPGWAPDGLALVTTLEGVTDLGPVSGCTEGTCQSDDPEDLGTYKCA